MIQPRQPSQCEHVELLTCRLEVQLENPDPIGQGKFLPREDWEDVRCGGLGKCRLDKISEQLEDTHELDEILPLF